MGRDVKHIYFEDDHEVCFKDVEDRFWYFDRDKKRLTELVPGKPDSEESIPTEVWESFGRLIGHMILRLKATKLQKGDEK